MAHLQLGKIGLMSLNRVSAFKQVRQRVPVKVKAAYLSLNVRKTGAIVLDWFDADYPIYSGALSVYDFLRDCEVDRPVFLQGKIFSLLDGQI